MASRVAATEGDASTVERQKRRPIAERFQTAVAMIKSLPKEGPYMADNTTKLRFYALYKQATEGPCKKSQPGFWDLVGKAKWEAWHVCGNMNKEIAMELYVEELSEMVRGMPKTTEVEEFLSSISPFYDDEDVEDDKREEALVDGEDVEGEEVGRSGECDGVEGAQLSSSVLHHVDELEVSAGDIGERREDGEGKGEGGSLSSNEDYQESFQDLQNTESTAGGGDQLSPWNTVSTDSSPSFEVVGSDPEHKTPSTKFPPEDPLPSDFHGHPPRGSALAPRTHSEGGSRSKVNKPQQTIGSDFSRVSPVTTIQHSSGNGASGDGVIVAGGHDQQPAVMTSSVQGRDGVSGESVGVALQAVQSQMAAVEERVQDILHQLNSLSRSLQDIVQRFCGHRDTQTGRLRLYNVVRALSHRRGRYRFLLLVGWPLLLHLYLLRRNAVTIPLWVWSVLYTVHFILSLFLKCGLPI